MTIMKLNKREKRDLKYYGYDVEDILDPDGQTLSRLIIISNGRLILHDSGYPYIKVFGVEKGTKKLIDLGAHDAISYYIPMQIDSLGKNIFRAWPMLSQQMRVTEYFVNTSSLIVGRYIPTRGMSLKKEIEVY